MTSQSKPPLSAIWFPNWPAAFQRLALRPIQRQQQRLAIIRYLRFCKETRQRATVDSARAFIAAMEEKRLLSQSLLAEWKAALRWFFIEGQKQPVGLDRRASRIVQTERTARRSVPTTGIATDVPPPASADLGIDRNSLFECRGGAPYKSTVKQYFHRFTETALCSKCKCLATLWRIGDFCPICGSISSNSTTSAVFAGRENFMRQPRRLSNRVYHTCFSAVDRTRINNQSPQS